MAEEIWRIRVFKHDRGGKGANFVVKTLPEENLSHAKLVDIMLEEGYAATDDVFYTGVESYSLGSMTKIQGDTHLMDMVKEYRFQRRADIHLFKSTATTRLSPVNNAADFYTDVPHVTFDDVEIVDDDVDHEQEKIYLLEQLNEMARRKADPRFHSEGDTDVEELFDDLITQEIFEPEELANAAEGIARKKCKLKCVRKGKGKGKGKHNIDEIPALDLSDPPSEGGGESAIEEDTDPENFPPPPKKRRSKAVKVRRIYFDEKNIMDQDQLLVGMCFSDVGQFRRALKTWHIVQGRDYGYKKNNSDRVKVRCKQEGVECAFNMLASQVGTEQTFMLRQLTPHTCPATRGSSRIDSTWLSQQYEDNFRSDPDWKLKPFMDQCLRDLGTDVTQSMAYRAKRKAGEKVLGNHCHQYKRVRDYLQTIIDKNPGSVCVVTTEDRFDQGLPPLFNGLFICLDAQKRGFVCGCRPFISIDGCFVKLSNGAQILAASGRDGNNNMFPIAFGVVGVEDTVSWTWFLNTLKSAIGSGEEHGGWTIMSDRQKGLLNAVAAVFPNCDHRFCKRHILLNMACKGFRGEKYKKFVDAGCYATTVWEYNVAMEGLKNFNEKAWQYLRDIGKEHWSRHAFSVKAKTDLVVNNLSEVYNKWIIEARDKPIVTMCEYIRRQLMTRMAGKREGSSKEKWDITPVVAGKLEIEKKSSRFCHSYRSGFFLYEVHCSERVYGVDVEAKTCECNSWQITGIPCKHACSAIYQRKELPEAYVDVYFKKDAYVRTYAATIFPGVGEHGWTRTNTPDIDPPMFRRQPGRPKTKRRRGIDEGPQVTGRPRMTTVTCSNCGCHKHTYRTCRKTLRPDLQLRFDAMQGGNSGNDQQFQEQANSQATSDVHTADMHAASAGEATSSAGMVQGSQEAGPSGGMPIPPRGRGRLGFLLGM